MGDVHAKDSVDGEAGGKVIPFPTERVSPAPLPSLRRTYPTPGAASSSPLFGAALTRRFDRDAA